MLEEVFVVLCLQVQEYCCSAERRWNDQECAVGWISMRKEGRQRSILPVCGFWRGYGRFDRWYRRNGIQHGARRATERYRSWGCGAESDQVATTSGRVHNSVQRSLRKLIMRCSSGVWAAG